MANMNASLATLTKELHAASLKNKPVKILNSKNIASKVGGRGWCGKNSGLATDTDWSKVKYGNFAKHQKEHGVNDALAYACARLGNKK